MCLQFTLIWTAPVFTVRFFLFEICLVLRVLRFSYIFFFVFYDVTLYYEVLSEWLTPICMY